MRRIIPLPVYKPTRTTWVHKLPRDEYLSNPAVKYPIYNRDIRQQLKKKLSHITVSHLILFYHDPFSNQSIKLPRFWREEYEKPMPILHQKIEVGSKRPQHAGLWKTGENGHPELVETIPIEVYYPPESKLGIWGGEGYIRGERHARRGSEKAPKYKKEWKPIVIKHRIYSEILGREVELTVTPLTLDLIDAAFGFDFFILTTSTTRLQEFGAKLKREMLIKLAKKDMHPLDPVKNEKIYRKYKKHELPVEQAEWVGLTLSEAMRKQWEEEKQCGKHDPVPLLETYTKQLREELQLSEEDNQAAEQVVVFERK